MNAKLAIAAFPVFGAVVLGYAYIHSYPPFTSQFVKTCDLAIQERLAVPSSYQRLEVVESRRMMTFDEFYSDPLRSVPEAIKKELIRKSSAQPVEFIAHVSYQAQQVVGAIIRDNATCTFHSLDGGDSPDRPFWVQIDGEYNGTWAARQPDAATFLRRIVKHL